MTACCVIHFGARVGRCAILPTFAVPAHTGPQLGAPRSRDGSQEGQAESKANDREGKDCLVPLVTGFNRVCKQLVSVGKNSARDGARSRWLLNMVGKIHKLSKYHEEQEHIVMKS